MEKFEKPVSEQVKGRTLEEMKKEIQELTIDMPIESTEEREECIQKFNKENEDSEYEFFINKSKVDAYPEIGWRKRSSREENEELMTEGDMVANMKAELKGEPMPYNERRINPMFDNDFEKKFLLEKAKKELKEEGWKENDGK